LTVRYENEDHETCCAGCQAVAQSIIDAGLGNYYKQRTADAEKSELPPPEMLSQLKLYDLPEVQADFVEVGEGDEREAVLMLGGITCAACVWLIEQQLLRTAGVVRVDLNYSTHRCRVVWDEGKIALSDILLKIRKTGYTAAPYDAQKVEAQAQKERKQFIVRLAVAGLGMMQTMMFAVPTYLYGGDIEPLFLEILHWGGFLMVLPVVFYSALPFYRGAWRDWKNRRVGMDTPIAIAASGVPVVIAASFARIFYRNGINIGLPLLEIGDDVEKISAGDRLRVDTATGAIENLTTGDTFRAHPLPGFVQEIAQAGGLLNYIRENGGFRHGV